MIAGTSLFGASMLGGLILFQKSERKKYIKKGDIVIDEKTID